VAEAVFPRVRVDSHLLLLLRIAWLSVPRGRAALPDQWSKLGEFVGGSILVSTASSRELFTKKGTYRSAADLPVGSLRFFV